MTLAVVVARAKNKTRLPRSPPPSSNLFFLLLLFFRRYEICKSVHTHTHNDGGIESATTLYSTLFSRITKIDFCVFGVNFIRRLWSGFILLSVLVVVAVCLVLCFMFYVLCFMFYVL